MPLTLTHPVAADITRTAESQIARAGERRIARRGDGGAAPRSYGRGNRRRRNEMTRTAAAPTALVAAAVATALAAWGTFGDDEHSAWEFVVVLAIIGVAALAVFGWAVPRGASSPAAGRTALVLSVLGALSIAAFWSGLPPVLAAGGAVLGWGARDRTAGKVAAVLGVLVLVADVVIYVADMT
jgi:hypothetical protein